MIPWKIFKFWASEITCLFPAHNTWTDGGLVQDFFPYLFALVGYSFLKFSQPLPSQKLNGWHLVSYFVVDLLVDAFGVKCVTTANFWREQGKKDHPPGRSSIAKMIFMLDWVGLSWFVAKSLNYTVNCSWFDAVTCLRRDHCYEHYQPVLDENLRCCSSHLWAYHLGYLHSHHSNRVAAAIPETLIVYQVNGNYGIVQCRCPSLRCHVTSPRF